MINEYPGNYKNYEHMLRHTEHHGSGIDLDADGVKSLVETIDSLRTALGDALEGMYLVAYGSWAPDSVRPEYRIAVDKIKKILDT